MLVTSIVMFVNVLNHREHIIAGIFSLIICSIDSFFYIFLHRTNSVSGKCILNMDHYCPWMSTCIGYGNYRYFVMFLVYLLVGCSYVIIVLGGNFVHLSPADRSVVVECLIDVSFAKFISNGDNKQICHSHQFFGLFQSILYLKYCICFNLLLCYGYSCLCICRCIIHLAFLSDHHKPGNNNHHCHYHHHFHEK